MFVLALLVDALLVTLGAILFGLLRAARLGLALLFARLVGLLVRHGDKTPVNPPECSTCARFGRSRKNAVSSVAYAATVTGAARKNQRARALRIFRKKNRLCGLLAHLRRRNKSSMRWRESGCDHG
ncbi:MAG: hypothetical protein NVV62_01310 [Terricaulis sp.]|nr:hypothetical protein [Terricaulis sp.]